MIRKKADTAASMLQVIHAMEQLQKNPKRAKELYDLYSGDSVKDEEIPFGIIDAARMYRIGAFNRFASDDHMTLNEDQLEKTDDAHLFILPSYFNHSCIANAYRTCYGDVMVVHAAADIKKGEEIYLSYICPLTEYSKRKETLNSWKFECHCQLCETDSKDKLCFKRDRIFAEFFKYLKANKSSPKKVIAKGEPILKKIRETYSDRNEYKIRLAEMLIFLSQMYADIDNPLKSIQYFEEVLTLVDNPLKYSVNIAFGYITIAQCYSRIGNNQKYNEMIQKAYEFSFCNNKDHFKMRFSRFL
uniref:SET domain-containing protein n=1 Tax=Panagrolaimus davidi TaxID=227884 RepID=A0A914QSB7_9BILA